MLGYADEPADLALGRTVDVLRTGDLGRLTPEGLVQVVGRRARFVKVLGHRIDLDTLEQRLRAEGHDVRSPGGTARSWSRAGRRLSPGARVDASGGGGGVRRTRETRGPRRGGRRGPPLCSGKPDYPAILAARRPAPAGGTALAGGPRRARRSPALAASCTRRGGRRATFAGLGGDSLSYVEVSIRLEELLGHLPTNWHITPVGVLERLGRRLGRRLRRGRPRRRAHGSAATSAPVERAPGSPARSDVARVARHGVQRLATGVGHRPHRRHARRRCSRSRAPPTRCWSSPATSSSGSSCPNRTDGRARRIVGAAGRIVAPTLAVIAVAHVLGGFYETPQLLPGELALRRAAARTTVAASGSSRPWWWRWS